jgi:glutamine synthetase
MTKKDILKLAKQTNVQFVQFWFTDVLGFLKSLAIPLRELETALEEGEGFDGSSIEGFARIEESDMIAMPDLSTWTILPWRSRDDGKVARMFCDILNPDGTPYDGDARYALKRILRKAEKMGYTFNVGPELEYFYFKAPDGTKTLDEGGYFDLTPLDVAEDMRRDVVQELHAMGIPVEYSHHEVAPSQHEVDLRYADGLTIADRTMACRLVVKEVAMRRGVYATFMPKPISDKNGSGMHTHQSLFRGKRNAFFDPKDKYHLSPIGKSYIAGLHRHAREICLAVAQWVNSYKRLVPGYEAPVYVSWARRNRSALIRVPMYKPQKEKATRVEFRCPDPACNPYLAFAAMLAAGLRGIEEKYELPEPVEANVYEFDEDMRAKQGIVSLPGSLAEAIVETEKSQLMRDTLGEHIFGKFIANKKIEWERYRMHVTDYEKEKYLGIL